MCCSVCDSATMCLTQPWHGHKCQYGNCLLWEMYVNSENCQSQLLFSLFSSTLTLQTINPPASLFVPPNYYPPFKLNLPPIVFFIHQSLGDWMGVTILKDKTLWYRRRKGVIILCTLRTLAPYIYLGVEVLAEARDEAEARFPDVLLRSVALCARTSDSHCYFYSLKVYSARGKKT